jgi:tripartite-type tricarboxylate transporter receptor subunit TctC
MADCRTLVSTCQTLGVPQVGTGFDAPIVCRDHALGFNRDAKGTCMKTWVKWVLLATSLLPAIVGAQDYPKGQVAIIVPFSPGGSNDALARFLGNALSKLWNQTVIVENKAGGGSTIGTAYVAKSPPDGARLLLVSASYTTSAATRAGGEQIFDPIKDLKPASMVARGMVGVIAGTQTSIKTLADLAREARSRSVTYGTAGVGSAQHFNAELLADVMGIQMTAIPYRGGNEAILDLSAGRIDLVVGSVGGLLTSVDGGKARPVAVLSKVRSPAWPQVPTSVEAGYGAALVDNYWAIMVPSATPEAIVGKVNEAIRTVTHTPEGRQFLAKLDAEPTELAPSEVASHFRKEIDYWSKLARKINISTK